MKISLKYISVIMFSILVFSFGCENQPVSEEQPVKKKEVTVSKTSTENTTPEVKNTMVKMVEPFANITGIKELTSDGYITPVISPAGNKIAVTKKGYKGLYILDIESREINKVADGKMSGYYPLWHSSGEKISYRVKGQKITEIPQVTINLEGKETKPFSPRENLWVLQKSNQLILKTRDIEKVISGKDDNFFAPVFSPDNKFIAFNGLKSGIYLYRIKDGLTISVGRGNHPSFSNDSKYMFFDRTRDNGQVLTEGELYITDLTSPDFKTSQLTATNDLIETYPSVANNTIVFYSENKIFSGRVEFK